MWATYKRRFGRLATQLRWATPQRLRDFRSDERGASIILIALLMPVLIGAMGAAIEISYWQLHQRAMQNAADAAATVERQLHLLKLGVELVYLVKILSIDHVCCPLHCHSTLRSMALLAALFAAQFS